MLDLTLARMHGEEDQACHDLTRAAKSSCLLVGRTLVKALGRVSGVGAAALVLSSL